MEATRQKGNSFYLTPALRFELRSEALQGVKFFISNQCSSAEVPDGMPRRLPAHAPQLSPKDRAGNGVA